MGVHGKVGAIYFSSQVLVSVTHLTVSLAGVGALLTLGSASACSYHLYAPPSRAAPLETPRALPVGQNAIAVEGAAVAGVFDPTIVAGALRYRRGLAKRVDGVADVTGMHVLDRPRDVKAWPGAYALRVGVKHEAADVLALTFGLGGGGSAAGGFIGPDLGLILGYENRYFVPFFSLRGFFSQPLGARTVDLGLDGGNRRVSRPDTTLGSSVALGFRIPLLHEEELVHSVAVGVTATGLCDTDQCGFYAGLAVNFEGVYALESARAE